MLDIIPDPHEELNEHISYWTTHPGAQPLNHRQMKDLKSSAVSKQRSYSFCMLVDSTT